MSTPHEQLAAFDFALDELVRHMQSVSEDYMRANDYNWKETVAVDNRLAPRYVRIIKTLNNGQRTCMGFVRRSDGAILYHAGWKAPYLKGKTPERGWLFDALTWAKCIGPHGVKTVR